MLELLLAHVKRTKRYVEGYVADEAAQYGHVAVVDRLMDYELRRLLPFYRIQRGYIWLKCQAGKVRRNSEAVRRLYLADLDEALRLFREEVDSVRAAVDSVRAAADS